MQYFKGDAVEIKMAASATAIMNALSLSKDQFYADAYNCYLLGDLIYSGQLSPLANAIVPEIFRETFNQLYESFTLAGTFESYLSVFRKVFGSTVNVQFTVPAPGKLVIDIVAAETDLNYFVARRILANDYFYDRMKTFANEYIQFRTIKGFESQYELEQMLFEMVPAGIFTDINLTIT